VNTLTTAVVAGTRVEKGDGLEEGAGLGVETAGTRRTLAGRLKTVELMLTPDEVPEGVRTMHRREAAFLLGVLLVRRSGIRHQMDWYHEQWCSQRKHCGVPAVISPVCLD
jgi:hypothetical protein